MNQTVKNLKFSVVPKSDQLNSEQLILGPMTITVSDVTVAKSAEQPVSIFYADDPSRPFKPCKTMRRVLIAAWGEDGQAWIGKSMTLFNDPDVKWAGEAVGGIRISHLSHISSDIIKLKLSESRQKKKTYEIRRLAVDDGLDAHKQRLEASVTGGAESLKAAWIATPAHIRKTLGDAYKDELKARAEAIPAAASEGEFQ